MKYIIFSIIGFLSGSIMYGYWLPLIFAKKDITSLSKDGNPGTANAYTNCGFFIGTATLIMELAKGFLPVFISRGFLSVEYIMFVPVMISPVLGHAMPFFKKNKGGKAIAVSFGVLLGILPEYRPLLFLIIAYISFSIIIVINPHIFRSVCTFTCFYVLTLIFVDCFTIRLGCLAISIIVILKHLKKYSGEKISVSLFRLSQSNV